MKRTLDFLYRPSYDLVARNRVDDGNMLLSQHDASRAIVKYYEAIEKRPYYAIAHYNKRIALSRQDDIPSTSVEHEENNADQLNNRVENLNLSGSSNTYFVISTVAAVPEHAFSEDSSDEEADEKFNKLFNNNNFPFTTGQKKTAQLGRKLQIVDEKLSSLNKRTDSRVVDPFLSKVSENGFAKYEKEKLPTIAISVGLNRMYSLSTRKNNSLILELESEVSTKGITYERFGYYWKCAWYSTEDGKEANFKDVRSFYKKLKVRDPQLAKEFLQQEENYRAKCSVPYQDIREYAKDHPKLKKLIKQFRDEDSNSNIYLHLVDEDLFDFNGVYSAYLRIVHGCYETPTVMSTGYEFPEDPQNMAYHVLGKMERMHRVITTFYIPLGTYYPEPNMCILIPKDRETVEESFIDRKRGKGRTLESPILLANIQKNRQNVFAIFSEDSPVITKIPERFHLCKQTKQSIKFSLEFNKGPAGPTSNDIKRFNQVSQSHSDNYIWSGGLFINRSIKYDNSYETDGECINNKNDKALKGVDKQCKKLIVNIRNDIDVELSRYKLANRIGEDNASNIVKAVETINLYNKEFNKKNARTAQEQELIDIMNERDIAFADLSRKSLLVIVNSEIMQSIKDNKINLEDLINVDEEMLEYISSRDEIIQALEHKEVNVPDLMDCLTDNSEDFSEALDAGYSPQGIVESYKEDPRHLKFMAGDPLDVAYTNSDDYDIVAFGIEHQYIDEHDIAQIREELLRGRDESAAEQHFNAILMQINEPEEEWEVERARYGL